MKQYKELVQYVLDNGIREPTRAKLLSTGEHIEALTIFGYQYRHSLQDGFPLLTTKRMSFYNIVHENLWFLLKSTNVFYLENNKIYIWSEWKDDDGDLGPIYPKQWRDWSGEDQIKNLIDNINLLKNDPSHSCGRRLIISAWNVPELKLMKLQPCHTLAQFHVSNGKLSCQLYQRSCDIMLGCGYNLAGYALLTHIFSHITGLGVGELIHTIGNAHIYLNHTDAIKEQLSRPCFPLPTLEISDRVKDIDDIKFEDFKLINYKYHPSIKAEVAI